MTEVRMAVRRAMYFGAPLANVIAIKSAAVSDCYDLIRMRTMQVEHMLATCRKARMYAPRQD